MLEHARRHGIDPPPQGTVASPLTLEARDPKTEHCHLKATMARRADPSLPSAAPSALSDMMTSTGPPPALTEYVIDKAPGHEDVPTPQAAPPDCADRDALDPA